MATKAILFFLYFVKYDSRLTDWGVLLCSLQYVTPFSRGAIEFQKQETLQVRLPDKNYGTLGNYSL